MNLKKHLTTCVIVAIVAAWSPFGGATTYDEAVDGDCQVMGPPRLPSSSAPARTRFPARPSRWITTSSISRSVANSSPSS